MKALGNCHDFRARNGSFNCLCHFTFYLPYGGTYNELDSVFRP